VSPSEEYAQRLKAREALVANFEKLHVRLGNIRLLVALATALMAWLSFARHVFPAWWLLVPVAAFAAIAAYHSRVLMAQSHAARAVLVYRNGLARIEDRWAGTGQISERFAGPHHVYGADLDLFGKGSLFELLSTARTNMGEDTLAKWLLSPSPVEQIRERQDAVSELRDQLDLREDLAVLGEDAGVGVHAEALTKWAESPNRLEPRWIRLLATMLGALAIAAVAAWVVWGIASPLIVVIVAEAVVRYRLRHELDDVLHGAEHALRDLDLLSGVLARLESQTFHAPRLHALQQLLRSHQLPGCLAIAHLRTIGDLIDSRDNVILRVLDVPLMYSVQLGFAAERWRQAHGSAIRSWLNAVGEMEALISLAAYSYEHPADPFPEFIDGSPRFAAEGLGHPLIAAANCVRNDLSLGAKARILLVSGSNMSGKSTLLRAAGINTVLAMAGAPVRARRLRLTPLRPAASIRINDSLQEGSSRFYAEITRIHEIFDLAGGNPPLLFLLDELLQGTNSNDRRIGAEGIVRALMERGAIGLVSTHDLALTDIGGPLDGHLHNVHFQDEIENGRMRFDYKLREGVVTKSNGLELMRSIGLDV
jgi:MutS-like protein